MPTYLCDDGNAEIEITADSAREAAQEYVDGGSWGHDDETFRVDVYVQEIDEDGDEIGDRECITITVEPDEPDCVDGEGHDWQSPYSVLGGLKENPGVQGHGGGVILKKVCAHCGRYKITDTWANHGGQQGFTSVSYEDADDASASWSFDRKLKIAREAIEPMLDAMEVVTEYDDGTFDEVTVVTALAEGADIDAVVARIAAELPDYRVEDVSAWRERGMIAIMIPDLS